LTLNVRKDFVSIVKQLHHDHEHFGHDKCKTSTAFCVYHFAGPVVYDASKFVERNADKLPDFLISVVATSTNGLIAHELGDMMKERYSAARSTMKSQRRCAIDVFQWQLKELLLSVDSCHTRYIRCIKPCHDLTVLKRMDHRIVLRQLQSSGLVAAVEQSRMIFPDKLSFETIATRYSCLLSSNAMSSIEDMDLFDKAQVILSSVYAPIIEQYNGSAFAMPFSCGHSKVLFRAGAMGILEKKRRSLLLKSAIIIQSAVRSYTRRQSTVRCIHGFVLLQSTFRGQVVSREFKKIRKSAVKLQAYGRFVIFRLKLLKVKVSILQLQKWWIRARIQLKVRRRDIEMKRISALKINMWLCGYILAQRQQKQNDSILFISAWLRMVSQRKSFSRFKRSATIVAAWFRAIRTKKRYDEFRKAATAIARRRKFLLEVRSHKERRQEKRKIHEALEEKIVALRKLQSFFRSKRSNKSSMSTTQCENNQISTRYGNIDKSSPAILDSSDASLLPKCDERSLSTPHTVFEQLEMYRRQIADLKSDITLLTSEAELHKQEVEAEFEDRLAEYEIEVLQLKQKVESLKNENVALKDEVAANVENVQNLKMGIQSMHEAHREYLNKVMRAVENANREHQIALELVQREKEKQVKELSDIVDRLQSEHRDNSTIKNGADNCLVNERIYHIARKIEKITAPDCIVAIAKKVRKVNTKEEYVEEKFSGRIRQLLYKLEDVAASSPPHSSCEEEYIVSLQQKLILAKSEIERLNKIIDDSRSKQAAVGRHGLKKFFER
jgi:myosin heavy subunit